MINIKQKLSELSLNSSNSIVIDGVRYNSMEFLLKIKKVWVNEKNPREKDKKVVESIEKYLKRH